MQKTFKILSFLIAASLLLCACGEKAPIKTSKPQKPDVTFIMPNDIISEKDYMNRVEELCATKTFTEVDNNFLSKVDDLGNDLKDMIIYNQDDVAVKGTKYYVSNTGDDNNDGLTPETAWATLDKVNGVVFKSGDAVLFERGGFWRGYINAQSGITYSAYGEGFKPRISLSIDALNNKWIKTDKKNIWEYDYPLPQDIGLILFNDGENYGERKCDSIDNLKQNFDYLHASALSGVRGTAANGHIYLYYDGNNPADTFWSIELSIPGSVVELKSDSHDITLQNLEFRLGQDHFFSSHLKNITVKYCAMYWTGGHKTTDGVRFGGGGGCWHSCDNLVYEHCYFYQQFDSGVTPQYVGTDDVPCVYKDFKATACLFEYCEYPFEYFLTQNNVSGDKFLNTYFGYNFVRYTGYGFGDKATQSACVKSWSAPNPQENFVIEKNIFDRPYTRALDMGAKNDKGEFDFDEMPFMNNNVYISNKGRSLMRLNEQRFIFNEEGYKKLADLGFETNAVYLFCEKY